MIQHYHANGKLLITGEYFILDGAVGLALPTKFGQHITIQDKFIDEEPAENPKIYWQSFYKPTNENINKLWLYTEISINNFDIFFIEEENKTANYLSFILKKIRILNPSFLQESKSLKVETFLDFDINWGLGSSSTLISLLAQWAGVDPYNLLAQTFGGSGYDIACATAKSAITYQLVHSQKSTVDRRLSTLNFQPKYKNHLYFVHLNKKQNSREGILQYKNLTIEKTAFIEQLTEITQKIIQSIELDEFCFYLEVHENIVSKALNLPKVKDIYFSDFPGTIKSLGAWGGDFVLVASDESSDTIQHYFSQKGFPTILSYKEMIL